MDDNKKKYNTEFEIKEMLYSLFYEIISEIRKIKIEFSMEEYQEKINEITVKQLIKYIKESISILINTKIEENKKEEKKKKIINFNEIEYEKNLQKFEFKERNLIKQILRLELQLNAYENKLGEYIIIAENYQYLKEQVKFEGGKFLDNDKKENEIIILRKENSNLKIAIHNLEEEIKKNLKEIYNLNNTLNQFIKKRNNFCICENEKIFLIGHSKNDNLNFKNIDSPHLNKINLHFMKLNLEDSSYQRNKNKYNKKTEKKNYFPIMNRKKSLDNSFINNSFKLSNNYWINLEKKPIFSLKNKEKKKLKNKSNITYHSNSNFINFPFYSSLNSYNKIND